MQFKTFLSRLSKVGEVSLPAEKAHLKMAPASRNSFKTYPEEVLKDAKQAGVMALFYPNAQQETHILLMLRQTYKGTHSAQVSFPGGQYEANDNNLKYTALRETYEEVGVPLKTMTVVKALSPVYIPPSNFHVQPYLGYATTTPAFVKQDDEVKALIEVNVDDLLNEATVRTKTVRTSYSAEVEVPAFQLNGFTVWGATAMMLSEVKDLIKQLT